MTQELAELCKIGEGTDVLDVASGTGESACFLSERCRAHVLGVDLSERLISRAKEKARTRGLNVEFRSADAHNLPFHDAAFDVAICECTLCLLDKEQVLAELVRVAKPGGRVGMHDLYWKPSAPDKLRYDLADLEDERPETFSGWETLFRAAGLTDLVMLDKTDSLRRWIKSSRQRLGILGQLWLGWRVLRRWGLPGLARVIRSERVFSSNHLGYYIAVGTKPASLGVNGNGAV